MKNLLNNISQEEKNRILEMHSGKKNVIFEQEIGGYQEGSGDQQTKESQTFEYLKKIFLPLGYKLDERFYKSTGNSDLTKGNDTTGVTIQFHHPIGVHDWFYKIFVFNNGKTIMDKQFPVNQYKNIEMIVKKY